MNNQERNRDALIEHIAEQDRIIRRRNEQIANQAHNARESQRAIEELDARNKSLAADLAAAVVRAEKAERERDEWKESAIKAMADLERAEQPRPLTAREHLAALWESAHRPVGGRIPAGTAIITRSDHGSGDVRYQTLEATGRDLPDPGYTLECNYNYGPESGEEYRLLDPPARPEGAEDIEAYMREVVASHPEDHYGELADHLASRGVLPPLTDKTNPEEVSP